MNCIQLFANLDQKPRNETNLTKNRDKEPTRISYLKHNLNLIVFSPVVLRRRRAYFFVRPECTQAVN